MKPDSPIYANHAVIAETETEIVIQFSLRTTGKPQAQVEVVLPHVVAAKLGVLLKPEDEQQEDVPPASSKGAVRRKPGQQRAKLSSE